MPAVHAKVITIVTGFEAQERVAKALTSLGIHGFSYSHVKGQGVHGRRGGGLFEGDNIEVTVVTTDALATKVLAWVETELMPVTPSIAYATDAMAVLPAK